MITNDGRPSQYGVFALGFSEYERATMESFFRIAGQRPPGWWLADTAEKASVVLLNATSRKDIDANVPLMLARHKVIIIGSSDFGTGWLYLPRPIRLMVTLTKLGELVQRGDMGVQVATVAAAAAPAQLKAPAAAPSPVAVAVPPSQPIQWSKTAAEIAAAAAATASAAKAAAVPVSEPGKVLVVDDSDVALKFMQSRLQSLGYAGQLARSGEEALAMVASYDFKFVFLDVMMAGLDGYQTCRAIKQYKSRNGQAPVVIMLTSRGGTIDKIRGTMAGCDGYLTKPLNERLLAELLKRHDNDKGQK
jgi:two-component system, cell cycle response regulator